MSLSTEDESTVDLRFHWLPFTVAYWAVAVVVAIVLQDAWVLFGFWLANPLVLAAFLLLRMRGDPAAEPAPAMRSSAASTVTPAGMAADKNERLPGRVA